MPTNYPASLDDSTSLPDPGSGSYTNNPSHLGLHGNENAAIKALEAKVGTGASTPPGGGFILTSSGTGTSSWQAAAPAGVWGAITGTLASQTDLQTALNAKLALGGGTMTGLLILSADPSALLGAATKQYVDALGSTTLVRNETPGGSVNGSNVNFTTAATFATGSLKVYLNGQRLAPGSGIDYVEVTQGFTMQYAPATGDVLLVDYETTNTTRFVQGSNSIIVQETPTGTVNSSNTVFTTLQAKYVANTLEVFVNGLAQARTTDYTETTPGSGIFTFVTAPTTGDLVRVNYQFATGASGNADTVDGFHASSTPTAGNILPLDVNGRYDQSTLPLGAVVQIVSTNYSAAATGTTVIPPDDTIPQNTEGDQYMTQAITPKSLTNRLVIEANVIASHTASLGDIIAALFQDSTVNAIAVSYQTFYVSTGVANILVRYEMAAGTTSSTTFKIRVGGSGAGTTTFNGQGGVRRNGGITQSSIKITEYKA